MTDQRPLDVVIAPEPFTPRVETMRLPALGQPVKNILAAAIAQDKLDPADLRRVRIYVDGEALPDNTPAERLAAMRYVPEAGRLLNIAVEPLGGGGDGGDKALQTVLTIALVAVSLWIGGPAGPLAASAAWVRAAAAAAVQVGGQMALSAIFAPDNDKLAEGTAKNALQDAANRYRPRSMMPLCMGLRRWGFDLAAPPYTTLIGDDQYLNIAVAPHYGKCWVGNIKLGETLLADYPAADYSIEYFLTPGVPRRSYLYPNRVVQENLQDELEKGGAYEVHTTAEGTERAEIDLGLPNGLRWQKESGKIVPQEVQGEIQYQAVGGGAWAAAPIGQYRNKNNQVLPAGNFYIAGKTKDPIRRTIGFELPAKGQYNVRVRVWNPDAGEPVDEVTDKTYWTALRSIERQLPILDETLSVIFLRIKSTDDLNGNLPVITGECEPIIPIWSGGNWNTEARSSNAAALTRWLLTGPAAGRPLDPDSEIHSSCATTYDLIEANPSWKGSLLVADDNKSQQDVMVGLGKMGRFSTYWNGTKLCFVPDWVREAPRQVFTGRNAAGYRYRRTFPEPIHAVFVEFLSLDEGTVDDELFVYADGYNAANATLIESIRIDFACTQERAFQEGRVYLAKRLLQVEMHEWSAGSDSVATTYGDRVLLRHPATLYGLVDGRVTFRRWSGALVAGFRLDEDVEMEPGKAYGIDVRRSDSVIRGIPVVNVPGRSREIMFAAPRAANISPRKGDLVIFGEIELISEDLEIIDVEPNPDLTVQFRAVPYIGPAIEDAINNAIPTVISRVTPRVPPPEPIVTAPDSAPPEGAVLGVSTLGWVGTPIAGYAGHWRERVVDADEGESLTPWKPLIQDPGTSGFVRTGPIVGAATPPGGQEVSIDVRVRTILINGESSTYTLIEDIPIMADVPAPTGLTAIGVARASADGSSLGAIRVSAPAIAVGDVQVLEVEVRAAGSADAWVTPPGGLISARNPVGDLTGLATGDPGWDLRGRWLRGDNWPGEWVTIEDVVIPAGSNVSSDTVNVGGVNSSLFVARVVDVESLAAANAAAVADLVEIYGDTASAAASAAAAALSEAAAILAAAEADDSADTASTQAGIATGAASSAGASASAASTSAGAAASSATDSASSAAASQTSRLAAEAANTAAGTSASAAATSAAAASASESAAGSSASAANTSALNAATSAGAASTSESNSAASATTAAGHAATATTQAGLSATSAGAASGSASAASGSASSAATSATEAGNSAASAAASRVAAQSTAVSLLPSTFAQDGQFWRYSWQGAPGDGNGPVVAFGSNYFDTVTGIGRVYHMATFGGGNVDVAPDGVYPLAPGRRLRVTARYAQIDGAVTSPVLFNTVLNAAYVDSGSYTSVGVGDPDYQWRELNLLFDTDPLIAAGAVYLRPLFRIDSGAAGGRYFLRSIRIDDITESTAAGTSASAAATQASNAATSATAAGTLATAASGSATTASTAAGDALTYAGQSSTSAAGAAASAVTAGTAATTATSAAATATTQASNASASAASASSSAILAATVANRSIMQGSTFSAFTGSAGTYPPSWSGWIGGTGTPVAGEAGGSAYQTAAPAGAEWGIYQDSASGTLRGGAFYVAEARVRLDAGTLVGAGVLGYSIGTLDFVDFDEGTIVFATDPDVNGHVIGNGVVGATYSFSRLFQAHPDALKHRLYAATHYSGLGSIAAANQLTWFLCSSRPATAAEIAAGVALPALSASVAATQLVVADLEANYSLARYQVSAVTGGGAAVLSLVSDDYGTVAGLSADQIYFGENTFFDNATDTLRTITGANARVIALGASFGTDGQLTEWEGPAATSFASMSRANAYFYRANVAPYVGGGAINTGAGFSASLSFTARSGSRVGAGTATTGVTTVSTVNAAGTVTYSWTRISGDAAMSPTSPSGAATAFSATLAVGETKSAVFQCAVSDGVETKYVTCSAFLSENT